MFEESPWGVDTPFKVYIRFVSMFCVFELKTEIYLNVRFSKALNSLNRLNQLKENKLMQSTCIFKHSLSALARRWKSKQVPFQIIPPSLEAFPVEALCRVVVGSIRMKSKSENGIPTLLVVYIISGGFDIAFFKCFFCLLLLSF